MQGCWFFNICMFCKNKKYISFLITSFGLWQYLISIKFNIQNEGFSG